MDALTRNKPLVLLFLLSVYGPFEAIQVFGQAPPSTVYSEETCRSWGFDPKQLSCDTCKTLRGSSAAFARYWDECNICCQRWRRDEDANKGRDTYRLAVIVVGESAANNPMMMQMGLAGFGGGASGEVQDFVESEDFENLVQTKGKGAIQVEEGPPLQPPLLMLYRNLKDEDDETEPDEIITLSRWKKDDIRDLLIDSVPDFVTE